MNEKFLGKEHPNVAGSLYCLAVVLQFQEDYHNALLLHLRAIRIWEKVLGSEHIGMAPKLSAVGLVYHKQKNYSESEIYYKRALSILENSVDKNHPEVASVMNNLGGLYHDQGLYSKAEKLHREALRIREEALSFDHPDVAGSLNSLALALLKQNKHKEAVPLFERSLRILEEKVGSDHLHTILVRKNLLSLRALDAQSKDSSVEDSKKKNIMSKLETQETPKRGKFQKGDNGNPNMRIPLDVMPQPLQDPIGRGRVLFQNPSKGVSEKSDTVLYVCGSCSTSILTEIELIKFSVTIAPNTEIVIRCNKCGSFNDATKYVSP